MKRIALLLATIIAFSSCNKPQAGYVNDGNFTATFATSTKSEAGAGGQIIWAPGDEVIVTNLKTIEQFTVTEDMISEDKLSINFSLKEKDWDKYLMVTASSLKDVDISGIGEIILPDPKPTLEPNFVASAYAKEGRFELKACRNLFAITISDKRVSQFQVSYGKSSYKVNIEKYPTTYYFPVGLNENVFDGVKTVAYNYSGKEVFKENYDRLIIYPNHITFFGDVVDPEKIDTKIVAEILKDNDNVEGTYNLEGEVLKKYLDEVQYDNDYSWTKIKDYVPKSNEAGTHRPAYVSVKDMTGAKKIYLVDTKDNSVTTRNVTSKDKEAIYDLIPGRTYKYGIVSVEGEKESLLKKGCFQTEGRVRYLHTTKYLHNFRDIGGWEGIDGKHIKYGILIRGSEVMNSSKDLSKYEKADYDMLINHVGVNFDLDFRNKDDIGGLNFSPLGLEYVMYPLSAYDSIIEKKDRQKLFMQAFNTFMTQARAGKCVYVHCQGGADRTGTFVFFIEGLLGVSDSDLCKDYEITSFYYHKERNDPERYLPMIKSILRLYGGSDGTVGTAIYNFAKSMGVTDATIKELQDLMLE